MSEITKLYENAHIEKVINHECTYDYGITCPNDNDTCENCGYYKEKEPDYPPFTAEKQLELIKLLAHKRNGFLLLAPTTDRNKFSTATDYYYGSFRTTVARLFKGIDETIAGLLNIIWQDLTEQERTEIAEMLGEWRCN